jgi:RimJ/RimL family protein N-acetyltransferase
MKKCGQAITPPSTVSYEYLSVGGILYLKVIADNQKDIFHFFTKNELAIDVQNIQQPDHSLKQKILVSQSKIFDGQQQKRFRRLFRSLILDIRKATIEDLMAYFEWTNEPATRQQSYSPEPIPLENHKNWFSKKVVSDSCVMYIVEENGNPIGQIRFDFSDVATISYSLDKKYRGQGLGTSILRKGIAQYRSEFGDKLPIVGFVKKTNIASAKAFRAINFEEVEAIEYKNSYKYILK